MQGARIYNLFPRLVGSMKEWTNHFDRIAEMNFDWVYINPFQYPGFSGSLYSIKDYYIYNPLFLDEASSLSGDKQLKAMCDAAHKKGLKVIMDLVINHTAIDSILVETHPDWYKKDKDGKIANPGCLDGDQWIVWGDLAQIDNGNSKDRDNLWKYWLDMMKHFMDLGIDGFRCDAAYHVPTPLWNYLIPKVKEYKEGVQFFGETLGCSAEEVKEVAEAGFDYVFNSSKWWDMKEEWFLREYNLWRGCAPSVSFSESHDTPRLSAECNGDINYVRMRYALSAFLTGGVMMPIGFEYGFKKQVNVCHTYPEDWETPTFDIVDFIKEINAIKSQYKVFWDDTEITEIHLNADVFAFVKSSKDGKETAFVIVNRNVKGWERPWIDNIRGIMGKNDILDVSYGDKMQEIPNSFDYGLYEGQVKVFIGR